MPQSPHRTIRIFFEKRGRVKYISHLDLMRAMSRAVRRAALPIWYTEGFNPKPYLSFPLPLPLGQEGLREALDLRLLEDIAFDEISLRMNEALPEGLRVLSIAEPWHKPGEIAMAAYEITFTAKDFSEVRRRLDNKDELKARKMGKQGHRKVEKEIALAPLIFGGCAAIDLYLMDNPAGPEIHMACVLAAGSERNLNPALLVEALGGEVVSIVRTGLMRKDGGRWE